MESPQCSRKGDSQGDSGLHPCHPGRSPVASRPSPPLASLSPLAWWFLASRGPRPLAPTAPRTGWPQCCPLVAVRTSLGGDDRRGGSRVSLTVSREGLTASGGKRAETTKYAHNNQSLKGGGRGGGTGKVKVSVPGARRPWAARAGAAVLPREAGSSRLRELPGAWRGGQVWEARAVFAPALCTPTPLAGRLGVVGAPPSEAEFLTKEPTLEHRCSPAIQWLFQALLLMPVDAGCQLFPDPCPLPHDVRDDT
ncbi:PREDICTED: uncharacterized protein LOC109382536 [Hipposideros armiger]|uniref:Uncharacterized protein LOC109382536 n=1 Tax=Hipposideros armiger TaxID=186990 RepID=A0A8B7R9C5_HIPAR|nr:PREDICTED: uncharacterized protein LOC109382536 [Hipposideros armiger]